MTDLEDRIARILAEHFIRGHDVPTEGLIPWADRPDFAKDPFRAQARAVIDGLGLREQRYEGDHFVEDGERRDVTDREGTI